MGYRVRVLTEEFYIGTQLHPVGSIIEVNPVSRQYLLDKGSVEDVDALEGDGLYYRRDMQAAPLPAKKKRRRRRTKAEMEAARANGTV